MKGKEMNELVQIPFHGDHITAITVDGTPMVALKPVCERFGLDWSAQRQRLLRQPWGSMVVITTQLPGDTQSREVTFTDRQTFTMWLATIETSRVKDEATRDLIETYQREAAYALDKYFHEGGVINPRATEHQITALFYDHMRQVELLQAAKGLVHADFLEAKARIIIARGMGEKPELDPTTRPLTVQEYLKERGVSGRKLSSTSPTFGKRLKAAYCLEYGRDPERTAITLTSGKIITPYGYTESDRGLMDHVWNTYYAEEVAA